MNCIIVNDASCLIDLRKGGLLRVLCSLPYRLVVPLPVRASEVLDVSVGEWRALDEAGLTTHDLTGQEVSQALAVKRRHPGLSANDCFCLVTSSVFSGILLTGDSLLRKIACKYGLEVHGVLWVVDQLRVADSCSRSHLVRALKVWQSDKDVFLPPNEINKRLEHLKDAGPLRAG